MLQIVPIVLCYLLGGVPSGLIIARAFGVRDIREHGSGNIGATNVWRVAGGKAAFWVYLADISKGVIAVLLGQLFFDISAAGFLAYDTLLVLCAIAAVVGNIFSLFLNFRGGKGVNTSLGGVITLLPLETLIGLTVFVAVVLLTRYVSASSILGVLAVLVTIYIERFLLMLPIADVYLYLITLISALFVFTHWKNIGRIINGTESKFSFSASRKAGSNA